MKPEPTVTDPAAGRTCRPCEGGTPPIAPEDAAVELQSLPGWVLDEDAIEKVYEFRNYHQTMAFVNAVAWIAHQEDHHPEMEIAYKTCRVRFTTHTIDGLSANDFLCAHRIEALLRPE